MIRVSEGKVYEDGIERTDLQPRTAHVSPLHWAMDNKKAILGAVGSIFGFLAFMSAAVPEAAKQWPIVDKIILGVVAFLAYGAAHASAPAKADVVAAVTPVPAPAPQAQSLVLGPTAQGPA